MNKRIHTSHWMDEQNRLWEKQRKNERLANAKITDPLWYEILREMQIKANAELTEFLLGD